MSMLIFCECLKAFFESQTKKRLNHLTCMIRDVSSWI